MFKVNKLTDYATVVLIDIARSDGRLSSFQLARRTGIPLPTVSKLMKNLSRTGLAQASRGATGGYKLGRETTDISIADIIQAVEGPIALTACADTSEEHCGIENVCPVQGKWNRVNSSVRAALQEVTLADMVADVAAFGINPGPPPEPARAGT